ncbi:MAG: hypothetical protein HC930_16895 [Hydrococcus sp. SU_1_0]|nr:hypothetical protein [Hydrococcus sp. SU_1_0]
MMQQYPERTIAVIAARAGGFTFLGTNPNLKNIPVLFRFGRKGFRLFLMKHKLYQQKFFFVIAKLMHFGLSEKRLMLLMKLMIQDC